MKNLKKDILSQIKKEEIKPISKNIFMIKSILIYIFLFLSIFIWAISFSIMLGYLLEADWFLNHKLWLLKIVQSFLPVFWLIFLVISVIIWFWEFKNTSRGYKFYFWQIILWNIILSLVFGVLFYFSGFSQTVENKIQTHLPKYREVLVWDRVSRMKAVWQNEEKWLLLWEIITPLLNKEGLGVVNFQDSNHKMWEILISKKTVIRHNLKLKSWLKIKLMWKKKTQTIFEAEEIRPYIGKWKKGVH